MRIITSSTALRFWLPSALSLGLLAGLSLAVVFKITAHPILIAKTIESAAELCQGPEAKGELGHFLLMNSEIKAVISSPDYAYAFSSSGGNILDLARTADNYDGFTHFYTLLNTYWPNQAHYSTVEIFQDGRDGQRAVVRATGYDVEDPEIGVITDYSLAPHDRYLTIVTTVTNRKPQALTHYAVGDAVQWGVTDNFAPGAGYELLNVNRPFPWVVTQGEKISYGYTLDADQFDSMNHSTWTDSYVRNLTLAPGQSYVFTRHLAVGTGSAASAAEVLFSLRNTPTGIVAGYLREQESEAPIAGGLVVFDAPQAAPFLTTVSDANGYFSARLPAGRYQVSARAPGRAPSPAQQMNIAPGVQATVDFGFGQRGVVRYEIRDADSKELLPAKLIFTRPGQSDPYFGNPDQAAGALNTVFTPTGSGTVAVPPGHYRVAAAHGLAYSVAWGDVNVSAGKESVLNLELRREVSPPGWFSADFHVHAVPSDDSAVSLEDRVTSLVAEGIEIAAATDHNIIADYAPVVRQMGLEARLFTLPGDELTTVQWGHFNAYPLLLHSDRRWGGAPDVKGLTPEEIFRRVREADGGRDKVVQINHPRWPYQRHAYFDNLQLDVKNLEDAQARGFSLDFDAVEIMNGLWNGENYSASLAVLQDWFAFLNRGYRFTAVGNSDSHTVVTQEVGYPRNYVFLGEETTVAELNAAGQREASEQAVLKAIKAHRVVVSNGPFATFTVGEAGRIGDTVSLPGPGESVPVHVHLEWPAWMGPMEELQLIANGQPVESVALQETNSPTDLTLQLSLESDAWVVVVVRGRRPMDPVLPTWPGRANTPFAVTNPIWIDRDANGRFDPPL